MRRNNVKDYNLQFENVQRAKAVLGTAWRRDAACQGLPREELSIFFPRRGHGVDERAVALCRGCEVAGPCLEWAMLVPETHGYWGGLTMAERQSLRRRRRRAG